MELIAQGAEAKIYRTDGEVIKERIKKNYRLPEIDLKLRKSRTKLEARLLSTLVRAGIKVPRVLEEDDKNMILKIEFIDGLKVRDWLDKEENKEKIEEVCRLVGEQTRKMHDADVVHADLTTSNMIKKGNEIYFIDFGLSSHTSRPEDKAVDIHLFKECLVSKHHSKWKICWDSFAEGYKDKEVLKRLEIVETRGRYKGKTG